MDTQITFRKLKPSAAFKAVVEDEAAALADILGPAGICRVVLEGLPHSHQGRRFTVHIEAVPTGKRAVRVQEEGPESSRAEPYSVIHDGFRRLRQQLDSASGAARERRYRRASRKTA